MKKSITYSGTFYDYTVSAEYRDRGYGFPVIELVYCTPTHPAPICMTLMPTFNIKSETDLYLEISEYFEDIKEDTIMTNCTYTSPLYPLSAKTAYYTMGRNGYSSHHNTVYYADKDTMFKTVSEDIMTLPSNYKYYEVIICDNHMCAPTVYNNGNTIDYVDIATGEVMYTYPEGGSI